jgi:uncharacterized membrane protein (DUF441 family)
MPIGACARATIRLGVVALMVAAASSVWELLAAQSPGTPLYIDTLAGPIAALRQLGTVIGVLLLCAGMLMPWASGRREPKRLVAMLYAGSALGLGAQLYAALHGMYGVQAGDLRADALPLFVVKHAGLGLLLCALLELGRRVLVRPPPGSLDSGGSQGPTPPQDPST